MEPWFRILLSNVQQLPLGDHSGFLRVRQALSDTAGNAQPRTLDSDGSYHGSKGRLPRTDVPIYSMPTVQSQSPLYNLESILDHQCQSTQRHRQYRYSRNPIAYSPQYQAYRARQSRDGNHEDAKWPEILEIAFLDALIDIPVMGRRKFSYKGKPHGRNELIKEYIWIAYLQSLAPGQRPDPSMARDRKQVSSHIQVLKGFLKDHPAFGRLFPSNKSPKNGFEDSFKDDPCLKALSQGRLPSRQYEQYDELIEVPTIHQQASIKPSVFWLLITSAKAREDYGDLYEKDTVVHRYTRLSSQTSSVNLDTISNWRQMFPYLESIYDAGELTCGIIHMDVSLQLMELHAQDGAELVTRSEMLISGQDAEVFQWQTITSLIKPAELCQSDIADPPWRANVTTTSILTASENETRLKVRFPAEEWAQLFTHLTDIQLKYEESQRCQHVGGGSYINAARQAREFVRQISMYQEIQSCSSPGMPFIRRAIILWTFQAAAPGQVAQTAWRYVDSTPSSSCISPSPDPLQLSAVMNYNLNSWGDSTSHLQHQDVLAPYVHELVTPSNTAVLQSSFREYDFRYPDQGFELPSENFSFESTTPVDSESILADSVTTRNIESLLSNTTTVDIGDYHHAAPTWNIPYTQSVSSGPAWVNYATIPPSTAHIEHGSGTESHSWPIGSGPRMTHWAGYRNMKDDLLGLNNAKHKHTYIEKGDGKLSPWIDSAGNEFKDISVEDDDGQLPHLSAGATDTKDTGWIGSDTGFDFNQLAERLKS